MKSIECSISPHEVVMLLRAITRLPRGQSAPGDHAAAIGRPLGTVVHGVDVGGWIAWSLAGLVLFGGEGLAIPTAKDAREESERVVMALAMLKTKGNISVAARMLDLSRSSLRRRLKRAGLYPWLQDELPIAVRR